MTFKSFLAETAETCGDAATEALDAALRSNKAVVDRAIENTAVIEQTAAQKIDQAVRRLEEFEADAQKTAKSAAHQAESTGRRIYAKIAKTLDNASKKVKAVQKSIAKTFSRKTIDDIIEKCPKLKKGIANFQKESKEWKLENAIEFIGAQKSGQHHLEHEKDGVIKDLKFELTRKKGGSFWSKEKNGIKQKLLTGEVAAKASLTYDRVNKSLEAAVGVEISGAVYKAELEKKFGKNLVNVTGSVEVLSAKAYATGSLNVSKDGIEAKAEAGAEASLIKGEASGLVRITPKTLWDNTGGRIFGCEAPKWLDYGIVLGGKVEAGVGVAAKASASLVVTSTSVTGSAGTTLGWGPMAGIKLIGGFAFPGDD